MNVIRGSIKAVAVLAACMFIGTILMPIASANTDTTINPPYTQRIGYSYTSGGPGSITNSIHTASASTGKVSSAVTVNAMSYSAATYWKAKEGFQVATMTSNANQYGYVYFNWYFNMRASGYDSASGDSHVKIFIWATITEKNGQGITTNTYTTTNRTAYASPIDQGTWTANNGNDYSFYDANSKLIYFQSGYSYTFCAYILVVVQAQGTSGVSTLQMGDSTHYAQLQDVLIDFF